MARRTSTAPPPALDPDLGDASAEPAKSDTPAVLNFFTAMFPPEGVAESSGPWVANLSARELAERGLPISFTSMRGTAYASAGQLIHRGVLHVPRTAADRRRLYLAMADVLQDSRDNLFYLEEVKSPDFHPFFLDCDLALGLSTQAEIHAVLAMVQQMGLGHPNLFRSKLARELGLDTAVLLGTTPSERRDVRAWLADHPDPHAAALWATPLPGDVERIEALLTQIAWTLNGTPQESAAAYRERVYREAHPEATAESAEDVVEDEATFLARAKSDQEYLQTEAQKDLWITTHRTQLLGEARALAQDAHLSLDQVDPDCMESVLEALSRVTGRAVCTAPAEVDAGQLLEPFLSLYDVLRYAAAHATPPPLEADAASPPPLATARAARASLARLAVPVQPTLAERAASAAAQTAARARDPELTTWIVVRRFVVTEGLLDLYGLALSHYVQRTLYEFYPGHAEAVQGRMDLWVLRSRLGNSHPLHIKRKLYMNMRAQQQRAGLVGAGVPTDPAAATATNVPRRHQAFDRARLVADLAVQMPVTTVPIKCGLHMYAREIILTSDNCLWVVQRLVDGMVARGPGLCPAPPSALAVNRPAAKRGATPLPLEALTRAYWAGVFDFQPFIASTGSLRIPFSRKARSCPCRRDRARLSYKESQAGCAKCAGVPLRTVDRFYAPLAIIGGPERQVLTGHSARGFMLIMHLFAAKPYLLLRRCSISCLVGRDPATPGFATEGMTAPQARTSSARLDALGFATQATISKETRAIATHEYNISEDSHPLIFDNLCNLVIDIHDLKNAGVGVTLPLRTRLHFVDGCQDPRWPLIKAFVREQLPHFLDTNTYPMLNHPKLKAMFDDVVIRGGIIVHEGEDPRYIYVNITTRRCFNRRVDTTDTLLPYLPAAARPQLGSVVDPCAGMPGCHNSRAAATLIIDRFITETAPAGHIAWRCYNGKMCMGTRRNYNPREPNTLVSCARARAVTIAIRPPGASVALTDAERRQAEAALRDQTRRLFFTEDKLNQQAALAHIRKNWTHIVRSQRVQQSKRGDGPKVAVAMVGPVPGYNDLVRQQAAEQAALRKGRRVSGPAAITL